MEQKFNENPHPCVGVMYPAFLNDVEPATGRDLPPDGMTPTVGVYCTMACHDYEPPRLLSASESEEILSKTKLVYANCN